MRTATAPAREICDEREDILKARPGRKPEEDIFVAREDSPVLRHHFSIEDLHRDLETARALQEVLLQKAALSRKRASSPSLVIENIKAAPAAYFKFTAALAFLCFVFSIIFYVLSGTIIINPIFAIWGAVGSILTWLLAVADSSLPKRG